MMGFSPSFFLFLVRFDVVPFGGAGAGAGPDDAPSDPVGCCGVILTSASVVVFDLAPVPALAAWSLGVECAPFILLPERAAWMSARPEQRRDI
jgi:hypothetical protein